MIKLLHHKVVIECDADTAPVVAEWLTDMLRGRSPTCSAMRS